MSEYRNKIIELHKKMALLSKRQEEFAEEILALKQELNLLTAIQRSQENLKETTKDKVVKQDSVVTPQEIKKEVKKEVKSELIVEQPQPKSTAVKSTPKPPKKSSNFEKFIGENLINKIGIAITVIGVAIGAKYSIEHDLISPLTRIILGYLIGVGLMGFGIKLKAKFENFSAVLVSGAMAILYFITFAAYDFYGLFPQSLAFGLMVVFTVFTVFTAIQYNRSVIALIGLVGAYAVPFLLSDGSGRVGVLFGYMAIINCGILIISFKKYWKSLYYVAFGLTWLIFISWVIDRYSPTLYFELALTYLSVFFAIFYVTFLAYKLIRKEQFNAGDVVLMLINSFIFFGLGFAFLSDQTPWSDYLGLFTLVNAVIHFVVSSIIYKQKLSDQKLFYLSTGMVLVFITIAIPIQLDGNWVTLLWAGQAALLFWIGRSKQVSAFEILSYPLVFLAFFSLVHDWFDLGRHTPIVNIGFLTGLMVALSFGFMVYYSQKNKLEKSTVLSQIMGFITPSLLIITVFAIFRIEINHYWGLKMDAVADQSLWLRIRALSHFNVIWGINYGLLFFAILTWINEKFIKNKVLGMINWGLMTICILTFLTEGLYLISELRDQYLDAQELFNPGVMYLLIRYISIGFLALTFIVFYHSLKKEFIKHRLSKIFEFLMHLTILWVLSSELIHWMDFLQMKGHYKLGLSILWGIYSLVMIILGIWKTKKYLRIGAFVLFGVTLIKLFFYDIAQLDTIAKTIIFVSLGILLLIISFLYNKYKHIIADETDQ